MLSGLDTNYEKCLRWPVNYSLKSVFSYLNTFNILGFESNMFYLIFIWYRYILCTYCPSPSKEVSRNKVNFLEREFSLGNSIIKYFLFTIKRFISK